jgi:hypothetical protein
MPPDSPTVFVPQMSLRDLIDLHKRNVVVLCHVCGHPLTFALSRERAAEEQSPLGVFCPTDKDHVSIMIEVQRNPSFWKQFKDRPPSR